MDARRPGMAALDTVLIFRSELLPLSETFIFNQMRAMRSFDPVLTGLRLIPNSIDLNQRQTISIAGCRNTLRDGLRRRLFCEFRHDPGFLRRVAKTNPALLHSHFAVDACLSLPLSAHLGVPLIVTLHGYDVTRHDAHFRRTAPGRIYLRRRRELWTRASLFVCVSDYIRRKAIERGFPEGKLWRHPIGVDLEVFQPCPLQSCGPARVLFVGRLVENKGCVHLIRAMALVQEQLPEAELLIVGDGPLRASLEAEARGQVRRYRFAGMRPHDEVRRAMHQASVLVMPSIETASGDSEGLGMVMCEAQAIGLPGIAFRGTGVEEALANGESGLLVNPGDEPALAEAILRVLNDAGLRSRLALAGRRNAEERFDLHKQTALLEEKYREVLSDR